MWDGLICPRCRKLTPAVRELILAACERFVNIKGGYLGGPFEGGSIVYNCRSYDGFESSRIWQHPDGSVGWSGAPRFALDVLNLKNWHSYYERMLAALQSELGNEWLFREDRMDGEYVRFASATARATTVPVEVKCEFFLHPNTADCTVRVENTEGETRQRPGDAEQFATAAVVGPARIRAPIRQIQTAVTALNKQLEQAGVPSRALYDLCNDSLLSVCPACSTYVGARALLNMQWMAGSNVLFSDPSGGFERMSEGRCPNLSCGNTEHELFWCPDLNPSWMVELRARGIAIDPNAQSKRDAVWKPGS
jgi:hypothetical protein